MRLGVSKVLIDVDNEQDDVPRKDKLHDDDRVNKVLSYLRGYVIGSFFVQTSIIRQYLDHNFVWEKQPLDNCISVALTNWHLLFVILAVRWGSNTERFHTIMNVRSPWL